MATPVSLTVADGVVTIAMDDGKANALSPAMIAALRTAFEQAAGEGLPVVLVGRAGVFSGGFDLNVLRGEDDEARREMLRGGFHLCHQVLSHPQPVLAGCTGHAIAAGLFLLSCADYRIGTAGDFRFTANEVALGLTIPHPAHAILRERVAPSALQRLILLAEPFGPDAAVDAGLLDAVVDGDQLLQTTLGAAAMCGKLDATAHARSKLRVRKTLLEAVLAGTDVDFPASGDPAD